MELPSDRGHHATAASFHRQVLMRCVVPRTQAGEMSQRGRGQTIVINGTAPLHLLLRSPVTPKGTLPIVEQTTTPAPDVGCGGVRFRTRSPVAALVSTVPSFRRVAIPTCSKPGTELQGDLHDGLQSVLKTAALVPGSCGFSDRAGEASLSVHVALVCVRGAGTQRGAHKETLQTWG